MEIYNHPDFLAILLVLGLPITAVILYYASVIHKNRKDNELKKLIIEKNIDAETARLLIGPPEKNEGDKSKYDFKTLRRASILLGAGVGALVCKIISISTGGVYFWLMVAFCIGLGLLSAFITEAFLNRESASSDK